MGEKDIRGESKGFDGDGAVQTSVKSSDVGGDRKATQFVSVGDR